MRRALVWLIATSFVFVATIGIMATPTAAGAKSKTDCWCCIDSEVKKLSPRACKKHRGECYGSEREAKKQCREQECFCCIEGEISKMSPRDCKRKRGHCYSRKAQAKKKCRPESCWCCVNGKIAEMTSRDCKRRKGECYGNEHTAKKACFKKKKSKKLNPKMNAFLKSIKKASSPKDLSDKFEADQFSSSELKLIREQLQGQKYRTKIDRFERRAKEIYAQVDKEHKSRSMESTKTKTFRNKIPNLAKEISKTRNEVNMKVDARVNSLGSRLGERPLQANLLFTSVLNAPRPLTQSNRDANITAPNRLTVGERANIRGTGFGSRRGRVVLLFGNADSLVELPVSSWGESRITVQAPEGLQPMITCDDSGNPVYSFPNETQTPANQGTPVTLWVKLAGGEHGPHAEVQLFPKTDAFVPQITRIIPESLIPGGEFVIEGRNFLQSANENQVGGELSIRVGGQELDLDILEWSDNFVRGLISQNISGLTADDTGEIRITTCLGKQVSYRSFGFTPVEEVIVKEAYAAIVCKPPPFAPFAGFFGDEARVTIWPHTLENGWEVQDCWMDMREHGINAGASFERRPSAGSTNCRTVIKIWCDGFSGMNGDVYLAIKGPRGMSPGPIGY